MRFNSIFQDYLGTDSSSDVFLYLQHTLTDSITLWDYFVNWQKVLKNFNRVEVNLNILNYLVGKDDIENEFHSLLVEYPTIAEAIPILIACRTANFKILIDYELTDFIYKSFNFRPKAQLNEREIQDIIEFSRESGILKLIQNRTIKSLPDYVLGVEVGLDSNGRKNRGGTTMETIVASLLKQLCQQQDFQFMSQATSSKIKEAWGINVAVDKSSRRFDFAVLNQEVLYFVETNFYSGGGSKLKSTAGEYKILFNFLAQQGYKFIWVTDGLGWKTSLRPLEEAFNVIDYTMNLNMVSTGLLSEIITSKF